MNLNFVNYYFIGINILGFVCAVISSLLYRYTADKDIDIIMYIVMFIGGAIGILIEIVLFDRELKKIVMLSRVAVVCFALIQIIIFLFINGFHADTITLNFVTFFKKHKILVAYLLIINVVAIVVYGIDKIAAVSKTSRIKIVTLLGIAMLGGSVGALIGMYAFHHKVRQIYFSLGVPLIIFTQIIMIFYFMNLGWF